MLFVSVACSLVLLSGSLLHEFNTVGLSIHLLVDICVVCGD